MRTGLGETSTPERGVEDSEGPPIIGEATTAYIDSDLGPVGAEDSFSRLVLGPTSTPEIGPGSAAVVSVNAASRAVLRSLQSHLDCCRSQPIRLLRFVFPRTSHQSSDKGEWSSCRTSPTGRKSDHCVQVSTLIASNSFKAFIFYAYTREVEFAPLRSQHQAYDRGSGGSEDTPPRCSPKSMYRMAEKVQSGHTLSLPRPQRDSLIYRSMTYQSSRIRA